jgi:hypothetical protein
MTEITVVMVALGCTAATSAAGCLSGFLFGWRQAARRWQAQRDQEIEQMNRIVDDAYHDAFSSLPENQSQEWEQ